MLHVLTHNILPVFVMLALGFALGRSRTVSLDEARALNRVAFLVLQSPLIFLLLTGLDLGSFRVDAILIYLACEVVGFLAGFLVARHVFRCDLAEAWLLGMAVVFVNTLLYIWPISVLIHGDTGALPVTAIVALDSSVTFGFFIISTEVIAGGRSARAALPKIVRNPILITIVVSLVLNVLGVPIAEPITTAARFAGSAAAPITLFAMGVVLSSHAIRPNATVAGIVGLKLLVFPFLVWLGFAALAPGNPWEGLFVMAAAGPSGAMAFALALLHGVPTRNIAPVIIWTSVLSLISLAWLA